MHIYIYIIVCSGWCLAHLEPFSIILLLCWFVCKLFLSESHPGQVGALRATMMKFEGADSNADRICFGISRKNVFGTFWYQETSFGYHQWSHMPIPLLMHTLPSRLCAFL